MKKLSVLLGLLAGIALALQAPSDGAAEAVAMPMVDADDCIFCIDIHPDCEAGEHQAWEAVAFPNYTRNGGVHNSKPCFPGSCDTKHGPACPPREGGGHFAMVDMEQLRGSIKAKDARAVKDLLADYAHSTALNVERSAVQVINCQGAVIAHFPVGQKLLHQVSTQ